MIFIQNHQYIFPHPSKTIFKSFQEMSAFEVHVQSVDSCGAVQGKSINKALRYKNPGLLDFFFVVLCPLFSISHQHSHSPYLNPILFNHDSSVLEMTFPQQDKIKSLASLLIVVLKRLSNLMPCLHCCRISCSFLM